MTEDEVSSLRREISSLRYDVNTAMDTFRDDQKRQDRLIEAVHARVDVIDETLEKNPGLNEELMVRIVGDAFNAAFSLPKVVSILGSVLVIYTILSMLQHAFGF